MILIFGGTTEGRLSIDVCEVAGKPFYYSTKSDRQEVEMHHGVRLTGAMTSAGITAFVKEHDIRLIIDAAHPFAENLHEAIQRVSASYRCPDGSPLSVIRLQRIFTDKKEGVIYCRDFQNAMQKLKHWQQEEHQQAPSLGRAGEGLLLALSGANTIAKLKPYWQKHPTIFRILQREESIAQALKEGLQKEQLIFYTEPPTVEDEMAMMQRVGCAAILTKESGETGGFDIKVDAALRLGLKVFVVEHPQLPKGWIYVTGRHTLRRAIEHLLPDFFPLKTGLTTGACATAATKAALLSLLYDEQSEEVSFALPDGEVLTIPVTIEGKGIASVFKDYSDDPDVLRGCKIISKVEISQSQCSARRDACQSKNLTTLKPHNIITFIQGRGVGRVTLPGLGIPVGEPAINPTPRRMIENEVREFFNSKSSTFNSLDVTISVKNGEELAKHTFNPKVGVVDGISIIGTSGIVSPLSNEAFVESIGRELQVAKAIGCTAVGIVSGKKGEMALREEEPDLRIIHYGNFEGETLKKASALGFERVTVGIMIGKAVKLAEGHLDTHSHKVQMNKEFLKTLILQTQYHTASIPQNHTTSELAAKIDGITMARELWGIMPQSFFDTIRRLCYQHCRTVFPKGELIIKLICDEQPQ